MAEIKVSANKSENTNMIMTELEKNKDQVYKDPCNGDSGGPLMYQDPPSSRWIILGQ